MDKFQQAMKDAASKAGDAASKAGKGMPKGGGGGAGKAVVAGATMLLGLGAVSYGAYNSVVTGFTI
jgi:hypothetical protein